MEITGVDKAVAAYHQRDRIDIMLDRNTGEVWADEFTDDNSFIMYRDPAICRVIPNIDGFDSYYKIITNANITETAKRLCEEWKTEQE